MRSEIQEMPTAPDAEQDAPICLACADPPEVVVHALDGRAALCGGCFELAQEVGLSTKHHTAADMIECIRTALGR